MNLKASGVGVFVFFFFWRRKGLVGVEILYVGGWKQQETTFPYAVTSTSALKHEDLKKDSCLLSKEN